MISATITPPTTVGPPTTVRTPATSTQRDSTLENGEINEKIPKQVQKGKRGNGQMVPTSIPVSCSVWKRFCHHWKIALQDGSNYGVLSSRNSMKEELLGKQLESLEINMLALHERQKEFDAIVKSLERISRDAHLLLKEEQKHVSLQQMEVRVGGGPSVSDCLEGLRTIHEMHLSEYRLKSCVVLALKWNSSPGDLAAFSQLLSDQPNIPKLEVQLIFARIFMDDIN